MGGCASLNKEVDKEAVKLAQLQYLNFDEVDDDTYLFTKGKVLKVYDGDTFWVAAWHDNRIQKFRVRLYGIDCSEMKGGTVESKLHAQKAKEYVEYKILNQIIDIEIMNNRNYIHPETGKSVKVNEKFGRLLAIVKLGEVDLAKELIELGLGVAYYGGKKREIELP